MHFSYSPAEIDALALAGCETVVAQPGTVCSYDVEAYRRIERREVQPGGYKSYDPPPVDQPGFAGSLSPECIVNEPYHLRINGFCRENILGPDEAGAMLSSAGFAFSDSLGHGLFEHLVLCRKYGVAPVFEAPAMGLAYPFLKSELPVFEQRYRRHIAEFAEWIRRAASVYGGEILNRSAHPWMLWSPHSPLALFMLSARRKPEATAGELKAESGADRLEGNPKTPTERVKQLKAWAFIRRRHMEVRSIMAAALREVVASDAVLIDNAHVLPVVDYELLGTIYDHPGVAVRSGYLDDASTRSANVSYGVRLFRDLTGKDPIVSVRINLTAAGTRVIPGPRAIEEWCDSAMRHGVAGYYFWPVDYPGSEGQYQGPMLGNPDASARGQQRWEAMLDVCRRLSDVRRFQPPDAKLGILVPYDYLDLAGWQRIFNAFVALENLSCFSQLIAARNLSDRRNVLFRFEVLVLPACPYLSGKIAALLEEYVRRGGTLVVSCPEGLLFDENGRQRDRFADIPLDSQRTHASTVHNLGEGVVCFPQDVVSFIGQLDVDKHSWIYSVRTRDLAGLTGKAGPIATPAADPAANLRHYMYEHSAKSFTSFVEEIADFPEDDAGNHNPRT